MKPPRDSQMQPTDLWDNPAALAIVDETVERAVAPYVGKVSEERLEEVRQFIRDALLMHPSLSRLTSLAIPPPVVEASGTVAKEPAAQAGAEPSKRTRGGDGG